jgi:hypothetical protein
MPSARATSAWLRPRALRAARIRAQNTFTKTASGSDRALFLDSDMIPISSATYRPASCNPLIFMVGATGIEPVTPTMST